MVMAHVKIQNSAEFAQGSLKWVAVRRTMVTGSNVGVLVHPTPGNTTNAKKLSMSYAEKKNVEDLRAEMVLGEDTFQAKKIFKYGSLHEKDAVEEYRRVMKGLYTRTYPGRTVSDVEWESVDFYVHKEGILMASPDGEVTITLDKGTETEEVHRGIIECKCPVGGYFMSFGSADPAIPITYAKYPWLLKPSPNRKTPLKWGRDVLSKPKLDLGLTDQLNDKRSLYQTGEKDTSAWYTPSFSIKGYFSQHYVQVLCNLFLSGCDFGDYIVWTDPTAHPETHRFWYKHASDRHPSIHIERVYSSDPQAMEDWARVQEMARGFTSELRNHLQDNIRTLLSSFGQEKSLPQDVMGRQDSLEAFCSK